MIQTDVVPTHAVTSVPASVNGTAADLDAALRKRIEGEVRFEAGTRALCATDLSIYRQPPIGVVIPKSIDDVIATVDECRNRGVPILGRGCGTSLARNENNAYEANGPIDGLRAGDLHGASGSS